MFSIVLDMVTILVMVPIAVAKQHHQKKLGEEIFLLHLALKHHNLSSKEARSATQGRNLKAEVMLAFFVLLMDTRPKVALPSVGWALPHELFIKNFLHSLVHKLIFRGICVVKVPSSKMTLHFVRLI